MRVLVIANNLRQASYRLRIEALIPLLAGRGFDVQVRLRPRAWRARRELLRSAGQFDAVILQRKLLGSGDARLLRHHSRLLFVDVDDAVMYPSGPAGWLARWRSWSRFRATAPRVDHVVAGNAYLADLFRENGSPQTSIIPTVVDPAHYTVRQHEPTEKPTLVWIGSRSTLPYLMQCRTALADAARQVPGLKLLTIADATLADCPIPLEHVAWSVEAESAALARGDIGIAPMPDDRWTRGKCGFKIIQYMASGLPVIASPVGVNAELVEPGKTGFHACQAKDWPQAIVRLAGDARLRAEMGRRAREVVERDYSLWRAVEDWARLLTREHRPIGTG